MAIRKGVCPTCGAVQNVDTSLRADVCSACNTAYAVSAAISGQPTGAAEYLEKGKSYLRIGAAGKAHECFLEGLALDPENDALKIFYHGFRFFDAEEYIQRHPTMEPYEVEYLTLNTDPALRRHYFLRFFDGSVYKPNPSCSYRDKLVRRSTSVIDEHRCEMFCQINNGLPDVTIYITDDKGGLRSPEQVEFLFSHDTEKKFRKGFYAKKQYPAQSKTIYYNKKTIFGNYVEASRKLSFPAVSLCPYDVIAGNQDVRERARESFYGEEIPFELRVAPNPAIASLIRRYYPK